MTSFKRFFATFFVASLFVVGTAGLSLAACQGSPNGNCNAAGGEECDDNNAVAGDGCTNCLVDPGYDCGACNGTTSGDICGLIVCGNDITQTGEECDEGNSLTNDCCDDNCQFESNGFVCRAGVGLCNPAETCGGASDECPTDVTTGGVCRASVGACDPEENCDGGGLCPADEKSPDGTECRADAGICDVGPETCDGTNNACPADVPQNAGTTCRAAAGVCDVLEACDGSSGACPDDDLRSSATECRVAAGVCDEVENCTGSSEDCPGDGKLGGETTCREAVHPDCDFAEVCEGGDDCPDDLIDCPGDADGLDCTISTCEADGQCASADTCVEICRGPGFYQTHSGFEKDGDDIAYAILNATGPLEVCGNTVAASQIIGSLYHPLEGLCIKVQGVKQRSFNRLLLTTRFNCAMSEGLDCDQITSRFIDVLYSECDALCAGNPVMDGPTLQECKHELGCFNAGGRIVDGECSKGTCNDDGETECGGDFGECADNADCVRYADACTIPEFCSEENTDAEAQICPKDFPASSPKLCNTARHNNCTIDSCPTLDPDFSCDGFCGSAAPSGCYCDEESCGAMDNCPDRDVECPGTCQ